MLRILVVDDNLNELRLMNRLLGSQGYSIDTVDNYDLAFNQVQHGDCDYDVIILDYDLGESTRTGLDLLVSLKRFCPEVQVVILTATGEEFASRSLELGAYRHFSKPFDTNEMVIAIKSIQRQKNIDTDIDYLTSFLEISTSISSGLELEQILRMAVDHTFRILNVRVSLAIIDRQNRNISSLHSRGYPKRTESNYTFENVLDAVENPPLRETGMLFINNLDFLSLPNLALPHKEKLVGFSSYMLVPIMVHRRAIGVIGVATDAERAPLTDLDLLIIEMLAKQVGNAISNSQKHMLVTALNRAIEDIQSKRASRPILDAIVHQAYLLLNAAWASAILYESGLLKEVSTFGSIVSRHRDSARPNGHSAYAINNGESIAIEDVDDYDPSLFGGIAINPDTLTAGHKSLYGIPINIREETVGIVWLHFFENKALSSYELQQFQIFVHQAALAYENAHQLDRLGKIKHASQTIASLMALNSDEDMLARMVETVNKALDSDAIVLYHVQPRRRTLKPSSSIRWCIFPGARAKN